MTINLRAKEMADYSNNIPFNEKCFSCNDTNLQK